MLHRHFRPYLKDITTGTSAVVLTLYEIVVMPPIFHRCISKTGGWFSDTHHLLFEMLQPDRRFDASLPTIPTSQAKFVRGFNEAMFHPDSKSITEGPCSMVALTPSTTWCCKGRIFTPSSTGTIVLAARYRRSIRQRRQAPIEQQLENATW